MSLLHNEKLKKSTAIFVWFVDPTFGPRIMLSQRKTTFKGKWAGAGGRQDEGELDLIETAKRELFEETGMYFGRDELMLHDSYEHGVWKCFLFEAVKQTYLFKDIKNKEPRKHGPWTLFTIDEALKLDLMPAIREYLLEKKAALDSKPTRC